MHNLRMICRDMFVAQLAKSNTKEDSFAKTFLAKADHQDLWNKGYAFGVYDGDGLDSEMMAAVIFTVGKTSPKVANLQLLHTFAKFRRKGAAKMLTRVAMVQAYIRGAFYFRVSAEPDAVPFYENIGFRFYGKQKSGCQLSIFRYDRLEGRIYDINDPIINKAVYKKGKGGCVEIFEEWKS